MSNAFVSEERKLMRRFVFRPPPMKTLFILNDAPYGSERTYNALRLAGALSKAEGIEVKVFLIGDASMCAKAKQRVPEGFYNIELMLDRVVHSGAQIGVCATCMDARGLAEAELIAGARRSSMPELYNAVDAMGGQGDRVLSWALIGVVGARDHHAVRAAAT